MAITKVSPDLLDLDAGITISVADNSDNLTLTSTDADANVGPNLLLYRNSGSPANNDALGSLSFTGRNDNSQDVEYALVRSFIDDVTDGTEDGILIFSGMSGGSVIEQLRLSYQETVFNEGSADLDFRVESNDSTHMFFVNGGTNKILMSANPAADTQSTPHDILTLATAYSSSGADGAAGLGPRIVFRIPDDEDNPSTGGGIAVVKESGDDSNSSAAMTFATSQNDETLDEAMRIDSSGKLLLGTTSALYSGTSRFGISFNGTTDNAIVLQTTRSATGSNFVVFANSSGTLAGIIEHTGSTAVTYNTSSDYRLKENIKPLENGLERLNNLKPVKFDWKEDGTSSEGFIAHEVQEIFADAVSGKKDAEMMQGMDYGRITPLLVKAIQELTTKLEAAEARITTLEG